MDLKKRRKFYKEFRIDTANLIKLGEKSVPSLEKELGVQRSRN